MRLSLLFFSALALALPLPEKTVSEYSQLLSLVDNSVRNETLVRRDDKNTIVMFNENVTISDKLLHVQALLEQDSHIEKLYDIGKSTTGSGVVGYTGSFSAEALALLEEAGVVNFLTEDIEVEGLGHEVPMEEDLLEKRGITTVQNNVPWHLARISHENNPKDTPQGSEYVYRPKTTYKTNIYIVDSGVRTSHQSLNGRAQWGANFYNNVDQDEHGHGTGVASIAASVSPEANIIAVKVLGPQNTGSLSGILSGFEWAINHASQQTDRKSVINLSLGSGNSNVYDPLVARAVSMGIPVTIAAGNNNNDACTLAPASAGTKYVGAFTVGSTDANDVQPEWSGWGKCVSMLAPGDKIRAAKGLADDMYTTWVGTSMSAPQVAGMASYWLSILPLDMGSLEWIMTQNTGKVATRNNTPNILAWNFNK